MHYNIAKPGAEERDLFTYLNNPTVFTVEQGHIPLLTGNGLGIDINEDLVRDEDARFRQGEWKAWRNPIWRGEDGAIREW